MKFSALFCTLLLVCSCTSARHDPPTLRPTGSAIDGLFGASVEHTRTALNAVLRERRIAIELDDATLGIMATDFSPTPADLDEMACTGLATSGDDWVDGVRYRLRIEIAREGRARTRVRVYADVQGNVLRGGGTAGEWMDCTSTGEIERDFLDAVEAALPGD